MTNPYQKLQDVEDENVIETESENLVNEEVENATSNTQRQILWRDCIPQIIACCVVNMLILQAGINMAFSAILLPQLNETSSDIHITTSEGSWIASLVTIVTPVGSLIIGPLMDKFGRRNLCMVSTLPYFVSWILLANAKDVWYIYCARVLAGFGGGLATAAIVYVSEISHPNFRPMLLGLNSVFVSFGILLTCLFGYWLHWRTISYINGALILMSLILLFFIPESPHWLIIFKDDLLRTARSLRWLYKDNEVCENQYENLLQTKSSHIPADANGQTEHSRWMTFKEEIKGYFKPVVYKPFIILSMLFLFQQLSGAYVIIFYGVQLFLKLKNPLDVGVDPFIAYVFLGIIRFVMAVISSIASKRYGRRPLLILSGSGMSVTILVAGVALALNMSVSGNIALYCVLGYVCFSSLACLVIPWTLIGELLPIKVRGTLGGFIVAVAYALMFGTVKVFPFVLDAINMCYIFYTFCIINLISICYIYFFLPETLGRSFTEIESYFQ